jgi:hypothetical protein
MKDGAGREMKHAGPNALDELEPFLVRLRKLEGLKEKKRGSFYRKGPKGWRNFIHFHEDPAGLFADVSFAEGDERIECSKAAQKADLLRRIRAEFAID